MKKYLNEKNLNFVAHVATNIDGFNLLKAIDLCIDEWYLGNSINEKNKYRSAARFEFNKLLFGIDYNSTGKTYQTELMINSLGAFFEEYIAPKYLEIQKTAYAYLDDLKQNEPDKIYVPGSDWEFLDFKIEHEEELLDIIRDVITDWNFGFEIKYENDIKEVNIVSYFKDTPVHKVKKSPVNKAIQKTTKKTIVNTQKIANKNKKKTATSKKAAKKNN
jgi:hypothetical protein